MPIKLKIKVTKEILRKSMWCGYPVGEAKGKTRNESCAIALAVRDVFPLALVWPNCIAPFGEPYVDTISLPHRTTKYVELFDTTAPKDRLDLPEHEFDLQIPDEVIAKINIDEIKSLLVNHPTLQISVYQAR